MPASRSCHRWHHRRAAGGRRAGDPINKVMEGRLHAVDAMLSGKIQLVLNTAKGAGAIKDSFSLRHTALTNNIPYYTTVS